MVKVKLFRDGRYITQVLKIGELPSRDVEEQPINESVDPDYPLGLKLGELFDEEQQQEQNEGVRVLQVMPSSPAYGIIFRGDIITTIKSGNTSFEINSIEDFESSLKSFDTGDIILIIGIREGTNIFEPVEIE